MSIIDLSIADTSPGSEGAFAPPTTIQDPEGYAFWLRERFATDLGFAQVMAIASRRQSRRSMFAPPPEYRGPYADVLKEELRLLDRHLREAQM